MNIEQIDQHVEQHADKVNEHSTLEVIICAALPVLKFAHWLLAFKPKWKLILGILVSVLEKKCNPDSSTTTTTAQ